MNDCEACKSLKKENSALAKAVSAMSKVQAETATENLKLKQLLVDNGIYFYGGNIV